MYGGLSLYLWTIVQQVWTENGMNIMFQKKESLERLKLCLKA